MRLGRVMGKVTLNRRLAELPTGALLLVEALDNGALAKPDGFVPRARPLDQSIVVLDELGAGRGDLIAVSEGREASMPWWPSHAPVDAYNVAIIDQVNVNPSKLEVK